MEQTEKQKEPEKTVLTIWGWQAILDELAYIKGSAGVLAVADNGDVFTGDDVAGDFREMFKEIKARCAKIENQVDEVFNELKSRNLLGRGDTA